MIRNTKLNTGWSALILSYLLCFGLLIPITLFSAEPRCILDLKMTANPTTIQPNGTIKYDVSLKNIGSRLCKDVSYSFYYASNEKFISATPSPRAGNYYWYVGNLGVGRTYTLSVTTQNNFSQSSSYLINNEACASASNGIDKCVTSSVNIESVSPTPIATTTTPSTDPKNQTLGVWIWDSPIQMTAEKANTQITYAKNSGFNLIYITIDDYLRIHSLPEGNTKTAEKTAYFDSLNKIIQKANSLGVQIDVEAGGRDWTKPENRWEGFALIDFVKEYNLKYPTAKIRGFQYDVEPYILPEYETNKAVVLTEYVEFINESMLRMKAVDAKFTIVIPHFYDSTQEWTPSITFNGVQKFTFTHLLDILQNKPGSEIILMSYRNYFTGSNGTQQISEAEIKEASNGSYSTLVNVAQETGNVEPAFITFYGTSKALLFSNLTEISTYFGKYSNYGGNAVHYLDAFQAL